MIADSTKAVLYINVYIKDASKAVNAKVEKEMSKRRIPVPIKNRLAKRVAKIASDYATASKVAEKIAPKMCEELPIKMQKKGVKITVEEVFREGPFFVLEMQVVHVNTSKLKEEIQSTTVHVMNQLIGVIGAKKRDSIESNFLPRVVQSKMQSSLGDILKSELEERQLEAEAEVLPEEKQARFFYPMMKQVREAEARAEKKPALTRLLNKAIK